jgi:hypothetical protein
VSHIKHISCELDYCNGSGDSNFLDLDWLSASDNERLFILSFRFFGLSCIFSASGLLFFVHGMVYTEMAARSN